MGSHQVAEPSLARDWPGIDASHSAGSCSGAPNIVFENSDLGFQIRVFILFFSFIFKIVQRHYEKNDKKNDKESKFPLNSLTRDELSFFVLITEIIYVVIA